MKTSAKRFLGTVLVSAALIGLAGWMYPGYHMAVENEFIKSLKKKLNNYTEKLPEDRVYLQFDKPFYEPGETIWFSAFVRDAKSMKKSAQSDIVHVEFISPKGTTEKVIKLIAKDGVAQGDFSLGSEALGGLYKVKAYTNWQKNDEKDYGFEKEIQVQDIVLPNLKMKMDFEKKAYGPGDEVAVKVELNTNENKPLSNYKIKYVASIDGQQVIEETAITNTEGVKKIKFTLPGKLKTTDGLVNVMIDYNGSTESISRSIPIVLNNVKLSFFPEGGDLVTGLESKVAFRALNEYSKAADVEGIIVNQDGNQVAEFSSYHMGMGAFRLKPVAGEKYYAKITKPEGIKEKYELPAPIEKGYVISTDVSKSSEITLAINSTESEEVSLVAQVRGKICYATAYNVKPGANKLVIPAYNFPMGVAQFTLFDSKGIAQAERLAFVNRNKSLNIKISTDKEKYQPREKVKMTIQALDEYGVPVQGAFALSVVNDQLLSFADDKTGTIISKMMLEYDLKEKVEEAGFYFDKKEEKSAQALDYLLMTSGWRRFTWEKISSGTIPYASYQGERALFSGTVIDAYTSKPVPYANIKFGSTGSVFKTDANGKFVFNKLELYKPESFTLSANGYYDQNQMIYGYTQNNVYYLYTKTPPSYNYTYEVNESVKSVDDIMVLNAPMSPSSVSMQEVNVQSVKKTKSSSVKKSVDNAPGSAPKQNNVVMGNKAPAPKDADKKQDEGKKGQKNSETGKLKSEDWRSNGFSMNKMLADTDGGNNNGGTQYYRARQFAAPVYEKQENVEMRTDFRNTIYWKGDITLDSTGKRTVEFYNSDDISSFRATVEGFSTGGMVGRGEKTYFTQLPFTVSTKVPVEVATTDVVSIPVTLKNNTAKEISGLLDIKAPASFEAKSKIEALYTIAPGKAKTFFFEYKVLNLVGEGDFSIAFKACGLSDAFSQKIKVVSKGFPVSLSFSGNSMKDDYDFVVDKSVEGSIQVKFSAFPSVVGDLLSGVQGILREPSGCFEQTSMSSYPNIMVMDYMKTTGTDDSKILDYAAQLIDKGYKRLTTFETKEKGYEWFGAAPGHEGLTAYGLMQFNDMKNVYDGVDQKMIERTAQWLMGKKDGKGGWTRNNKAYHSFGQISEEVMNGYIVYALAEAGYTDLKKEIEAAYDNAMNKKDPYLLAMMANTLYRTKDSRADNVMDALLKTQKSDGSVTGTTHSITHSTGNSLIIETTSIAIMAMLKSGGKHTAELNKAVQYLVKSRSGYGTFGNTQGTVLALKALTEYAKNSKKTAEDGTIEIYSDGKKIAEKSYKAGDQGTIEISDLGKHFKEGKNNIQVKYSGTKNPLPYSIAVDYSTTLPPSSPECNVEIKTKLAGKTCYVGETLRLSTTLKNNTSSGLPSTMAIIGIPAGFTAQPWQLKELQEKKVIDYYEVLGNSIAVYYRGMAANDVKEINLDLKAEIPGEYEAPASSAYLYYTNEYKCWAGLDKVTIKKPI
ncbi:MAG: MG2 domain-containing protein [Bacteroidota bacterium]